jgi:hypothetical protein
MRDQFPSHGPIEQHAHHLAIVTLAPAGKWQTFDPQFYSERFHVREGMISPFGPDLTPNPTQISEPGNFRSGNAFKM